MNKYTSAFAFLVLFAGAAFAMNGVTPTLVANSRWAGNSAGSLYTEGGNITNASLNGTTLTQRWADFYGSTSGLIQLTDGTNYVYQWVWTPGTGYVCLSTNTAYPFDAAVASTGAAVDTRWGFASGSDQAVDTYTDANANCAANFAEATLANTAGTQLQGSSSFYSCAIHDAATAAKTDFAFCTAIANAGTAYNGAAANYEVMVPTNDAPGSSEQYYFYMQMN